MRGRFVDWQTFVAMWQCVRALNEFESGVDEVKRMLNPPEGFKEALRRYNRRDSNETD